MLFADTFHALPLGMELEFLARATADARIQELSSILSAAELERRAEFRSDRRRLTFTMGRAAARVLVGRRLGCSPVEVPLIVAQDGAVDVDGFDLHLSISHTDEGAIAVVSPRPVGVDLEPIDRQIADLHSYILTDEEYTRLPDGPIGDLPVLQSWVAKESVLKGMRTGLRTSPKELVLTFDGFGGRAFHRDGAVWRFVLVESGGFVASVAYQE